MAFVALDNSKKRDPLTVPTVAVYKPKNTAIAIPLDVLEQAGISATETIVIAKGEGDDAGRIAIVPSPNGRRFRVEGKRAMLNTQQLGKAQFKATQVIEVSAQNGALILTLPADFPWTAPVKAASAPMSFSISQARAA